MYSRLLSGFLVPFALLYPVFSQSTTPSSTSCVSPGQFDQCIQLANANTIACNSIAYTLLAKDACDAAGLEEYINCYLSDCWNEVYDCDYQAIAILLSPLMKSSGGAIPFYPAPDSAPGGCSCNIGKLFENFTAAINQAPSACDENIASDIQGCNCCTWSAAFAAYYDYCPDTNSNAIKLQTAISGLHTYEIIGTCAGKYDASNCEAKFGLAPAAGNLALSVDSLPSWTGTQPLSTLDGTITSPLSGPTLVWTGVSYTFTAIAASTSAANVKSTAAKTTQGGGGQTATGTGGAVATTKAGPGSKVIVGGYLWAFTMIGLLFPIC